MRSACAYGMAIVVNDGSSDETANLAADAGAVVVSLQSNRGYDGALGAGFARALELGCEFVITMDADGQHDSAVLPALIFRLEKGAAVVIGVRDRRQRFAESLFAFMTLLRWGIHDPLCGMKAYRMAVYQELGHFDSRRSIGTELAIFAARRGMRIMQVPVKTRDRADQPRFGRLMSANFRILRAMFLAMH